MSFYHEMQQYPKTSVIESIQSKNQHQIDSALNKQRIDLDDFAALISPAISDSQLETLATKAHRLTCQRFGHIIQMYAPLYISNECHNGCTYCGFNADNQIVRKTLSRDEIALEAQFLRSHNYRHMLILTGEAPEIADISYLEDAVKIIKKDCGSVSIEVFPMDTDGYRRMVSAGVDGLTLYQETYDEKLYSELHPYGPKSDYLYRLNGPERGGEAGLRRIGIGALLGLDDSLSEVFYTALHARYLMHKFWRTQVSVSFPRIRPAEGGFQPRSIVSDKQLTQFVCAMRLFMPDAGLVLSTRESASLRNNLFQLGITQMSAGSSTAPGGYSSKSSESEQFSIDDDRSPDELARYLCSKGYEAVWKDWDAAFLDQSA